MAKKKTYKRRGRRHEDSEFRKESSTTYSDDLSRSQAKTFGRTKRSGRVHGRRYAIDETMMTKRGKRIHLVRFGWDDQPLKPLEALCGAGRPNKEFPRGSGILTTDKISRMSTDATSDRYMTDQEKTVAQDGIYVTCYKCLKIEYMNEIADASQMIHVRTFSPTHEGNRDEHVMIPQGRKGIFVAKAEEEESKVRGASIRRVKEGEKTTFDGYESYFQKSRWHPGNEQMRTQPYSLDYVTDPELRLLLRQFFRSVESFGELIRDSLDGLYFENGKPKYERNLYELLQPVGTSTETEVAFAKLVSLKEIRRSMAEKRQESARQFYAGQKKNPLRGIDTRDLDMFDNIVERFHVYSRR